MTWTLIGLCAVVVVVCVATAVGIGSALWRLTRGGDRPDRWWPWLVALVVAFGVAVGITSLVVAIAPAVGLDS